MKTRVFLVHDDEERIDRSRTWAQLLDEQYYDWAEQGWYHYCDYGLNEELADVVYEKKGKWKTITKKIKPKWLRTHPLLKVVDPFPIEPLSEDYYPPDEPFEFVETLSGWSESETIPPTLTFQTVPLPSIKKIERLMTAEENELYEIRTEFGDDDDDTVFDRKTRTIVDFQISTTKWQSVEVVSFEKVDRKSLFDWDCLRVLNCKGGSFRIFAKGGDEYDVYYADKTRFDVLKEKPRREYYSWNRDERTFRNPWKFTSVTKKEDSFIIKKVRIKRKKEKKRRDVKVDLMFEI